MHGRVTESDVANASVVDGCSDAADGQAKARRVDTLHEPVLGANGSVVRMREVLYGNTWSPSTVGGELVR